MEQFKPAIKYGLIMGFISIVIFLLVWVFAPNMFASMQWLLTQTVLFILALPIVFLILGTRDTKSNFETFSYGQAFQAAFLVGLASTLLLLVFNLIFHTLIDPEFNNRVKELVMDMTLERMQDANLDSDMIDQQMSKLEERFENQAGIIGQIKYSAFGLAWYTVLALIIGIVYKDKSDKTEMQ